MQIIAADNTTKTGSYIRIGRTVVNLVLRHRIDQVDHLGADVGSGRDAVCRQGVVAHIRARQCAADGHGFAGAGVFVIKRPGEGQLQIIAADDTTKIGSHIRIGGAVVNFVLSNGVNQINDFRCHRESTAGSGQVDVVTRSVQITDLPGQGIVSRVRTCGRTCRDKGGCTDVAGVVLREHIAVNASVHKPAQCVIGAGNRRGEYVTVGFGVVNIVGDREGGLHGKHIAVARCRDSWRATPAGIPERLITAGQTTKGVVIRVIAVDQPATICMAGLYSSTPGLVNKRVTAQHQSIARRIRGKHSARRQVDIAFGLDQQCIVFQ